MSIGHNVHKSFDDKRPSSMSTDTNVVATVKLARETARSGQYGDSLQLYARAKEDIQLRIHRRTDQQDLQKWRQALQSVESEEASVTRVQDARNKAAECLDPPVPSVADFPVPAVQAVRVE
jgi:hypothetical protein